MGYLKNRVKIVNNSFQNVLPLFNILLGYDFQT